MLIFTGRVRVSSTRGVISRLPVEAKRPRQKSIPVNRPGSTLGLCFITLLDGPI